MKLGRRLENQWRIKILKSIFEDLNRYPNNAQKPELDLLMDKWMSVNINV